MRDNGYMCMCGWGFPGSSAVRNQPAMQETWVRSLGGEDPLEEEEVATHSRILAWEIPQTGEPGRLQSMESQRVQHNSAAKQQQLCRTESLYCSPETITHCYLAIPQHKIRSLKMNTVRATEIQALRLLTILDIMREASNTAFNS